AVANAVPAVADEADLVTRAPNGAGVREVISNQLLRDFEEYRPHLLTRTIELGTAGDGTPVGYPILGPSLLITGPSGSGKSTLTGRFAERLVQHAPELAAVPPDGDDRPRAGDEGSPLLA